MEQKPLSKFLETGRGERKIAFSSCFPLASTTRGRKAQLRTFVRENLLASPLLRGLDRQQERPELAFPLCDQRSRELERKSRDDGMFRPVTYEAARGSRTVSESDTAMQGIRSMETLALERLIERFVRSGHPGGYRKV